MTETDNIVALAAELGIERKLLYCWRDVFAVRGEAGLRRAGPERVDARQRRLRFTDSCGTENVKSANANCAALHCVYR